MAKPPTPITFKIIRQLMSEPDLWALAAAMERAAYERYKQLALLMARHGNPQIEKLFRDLAEEEREHERAAARHATASLAEHLAGLVGIESTPLADLEEAGGVHLLTSHGALSLAVKNEERAFALFTEIAVASASDLMRGLAEKFAKEELNHLVRLRLARLRLYRARSEPPPAAADSGDAIEGAVALRGATMAMAMKDLAAAVIGPGRVETSAFLESLAEQMMPVSATSLAGAPTSGLFAGQSLSPRRALLRALGLLDEDFIYYTDLLDRAAGGRDAGVAQHHAEATVERMALVRSWLSL